MGKITQYMNEVSYRIAKQIYEQGMDKKEGIEKIYLESGMNKTSADYYVNDFIAMREGNAYHWCMSQLSTRYFLYQIYKDYGEEGLEKAIKATVKHLKEMRKLEKNLPGIFAIIKKFEEEGTDFLIDEFE